MDEISFQKWTAAFLAFALAGRAGFEMTPVNEAPVNELEVRTKQGVLAGAEG